MIFAAILSLAQVVVGFAGFLCAAIVVLMI